MLFFFWGGGGGTPGIYRGNNDHQYTGLTSELTRKKKERKKENKSWGRTPATPLAPPLHEHNNRTNLHSFCLYSEKDNYHCFIR